MGVSKNHPITTLTGVHHEEMGLSFEGKLGLQQPFPGPESRAAEVCCPGRAGRRFSRWQGLALTLALGSAALLDWPNFQSTGGLEASELVPGALPLPPPVQIESFEVVPSLS